MQNFLSKYQVWRGCKILDAKFFVKISGMATLHTRHDCCVHHLKISDLVHAPAAGQVDRLINEIFTYLGYWYQFLYNIVPIFLHIWDIGTNFCTNIVPIFSHIWDIDTNVCTNSLHIWDIGINICTNIVPIFGIWVQILYQQFDLRYWYQYLYKYCTKRFTFWDIGTNICSNIEPLVYNTYLGFWYCTDFLYYPPDLI